MDKKDHSADVMAAWANYIMGCPRGNGKNMDSAERLTKRIMLNSYYRIY